MRATRQRGPLRVVVGSAAGVATLVALRARAPNPERRGADLLVLGLACIVALRFHLALVDLAFVARWPVLLRLQDAIIGTDLGERLYDLGTAVWFGLALLVATVGFPLYARGRADRLHADAASGTAPGPDRPAHGLQSTRIRTVCTPASTATSSTLGWRACLRTLM